MNSGKLRQLGYDPDLWEQISEYRISKIDQSKDMLFRCPVCGEWFSRDANRPYHICEHNPEELGLSPLRKNVATDGGERDE